MAHKYVLDTHALVWYLEGSSRLSINAKAVIDAPDNQLVVPLIALTEAVFIIGRGRTSIPDISTLLNRVLTDQRIELFPFTWEIFQQSLTATIIPEIHDRIIVATSLHLQGLGHTVALVTRDGMITQSGLISIIW